MISINRTPRNIIVCADGTGNKGGSSPDSNVYRVYKMVNKYHSGPCQDGVDVKEQILFYDNGIGTSTNKFIRAVTAGIGLGFRHNVCDLYKFLARNYKEGDRIFFFGFSRGASTVRACNGMISKCGLVKSDGLRNSELEKKVDAAYKIYEKHKTNEDAAEKFKNDEENSWGAVPIQFLGVWDTVVALGFPKRTDVTGLATLFINVVFGTIEKIFNWIFPHNFYHYKLTNNVKYACQALAIDDERTAFWPYVWQEKNIAGAKDRTPENVKQVWFAGMHANVGGGYERDGMAGVPLYWIMKQAEEKGLVFNSDAMQLVLNTSHIHGRMYNTRLGLKMIYRYHPREIENLCKTKEGESILLDKIKIHSSVLERLKHRTANYIPGYIPASFDVVYTEEPEKITYHNPGGDSNWAILREKINRVVLHRKWLYASVATFVLTAFGFMLHSRLCSTSSATKKEYLNASSELVSSASFNNLINLIQEPSILGLTFIILGAGSYFIRTSLFRKSTMLGESLRHIILDKMPKQK